MSFLSASITVPFLLCLVDIHWLSYSSVCGSSSFAFICRRSCRRISWFRPWFGVVVIVSSLGIGMKLSFECVHPDCCILPFSICRIIEGESKLFSDVSSNISLEYLNKVFFPVFGSIVGQ